MESPFEFFRKHQKQALVFLFLTAMLAFTVGDPLMKLFSYARGGGSTGEESLIESNAGKLTRTEVEQLMQRRGLVNRFLEVAAREAGVPPNQAPQFGRPTQSEVVQGWLMRKEADRMGISVDDEDVGRFLDKTFRNKLTTSSFREVCKELRIAPAQVFRALKEELQAIETAQLIRPAVPTPPEELWRIYQKVHTRQKIEAAAIPVAAFVDQVGEPSEQEVAALFAKHKSEFDPRDNPGISLGGKYTPGFRQPRKVQLQYLALKYEDVEKQVAAEQVVTDEEIQKYYDDKKILDSALQEPPVVPQAPSDSETDRPQLTPEKEERDSEVEPDDTPAKPEAAPEGDRPAEPAAPDAGDQPTPASPAETPVEAAPETKPETKPEAQSEAPCGPQQTSEQPAAPSEAVAAQEKAAEETPATEPPATEAPGTEVPAAPAEEAPAAAVSEEVMTDEDAAPGAGLTPPAGPKASPLRFKPLDDDLKQLIRERILRDRTAKAMQARSKAIANAMFSEGQKLSRFIDPEKLSRATPAERQKLEEDLQLQKVPDATEALKALGTQYKAEFGETGLLSPMDLSEHPVLGKTQEALAGDDLRGLPANIVTLAFRGQGLYSSLVVEAQADGENLAGDRYLLWKVREVADHVPSLAEDGVREQVVKAWKRLQAIPKARERAEALAKQAAKAESLEQGLAEATVTGATGSDTVTVSESPDFSWYRQSSVQALMGRQPLEFGNPVVIEGAGENFMQTVFALGEGETGVATNDDASIQYVVRVAKRQAAEREKFQSAPLFDTQIANFTIPSQYQEIANQGVRRVLIEQERQLQRRYNLKFRNPQTGELVDLANANEDDAEE